MFPADGSPPQMMDDVHGDLQCMQEAARILAANWRRLRAEQLMLLRHYRVISDSVVRGQDYALVPTSSLNDLSRTVAELYGTGR